MGTQATDFNWLDIVGVVLVVIGFVIYNYIEQRELQRVAERRQLLLSDRDTPTIQY